ncbi:hypothetical protein [Nostoc sp.]|uniref:hypothetical protein n=1 Tax=Nostoc sp. TaxID=1180 RepID=UPI002FF6D94A
MASTPWLIAQDLMGGWWKFRPSTKAVLFNGSYPFLTNLLGRNERSGTGYWVLYAGEEILLRFGWGMNPHIFPSPQSPIQGSLPSGSFLLIAKINLKSQNPRAKFVSKWVFCVGCFFKRRAANADCCCPWQV